MSREHAVPQVAATLMLFTFNHSRFLRAALDSITSQSVRPEELVLCDDGSTDNSQEILTEFAAVHGGVYRIRLLLHKKNGGLSRMLNAAFAAATTDLCVIMSADDVSGATRIERLWSSYCQRGPKIRMWSSNAEIIDSTGTKHGQYYHRGFHPLSTAEGLAASMNGVLGATEAVHREVWKVFGEIPDGIYQEDVLLPFRAALIGSVEYLDEVLVGYRFHDANIHFGGVQGGPRHSAAEQQRRRIKQITNQLLIARSRLHDLEVIRHEARITVAQREKLEQICQATLRGLEWEYKIATGPVVRSCFTVLGAWKAGVSIRKCTRFLLMRWWPRTYTKVMLLWWQSRPRAKVC